MLISNLYPSFSKIGLAASKISAWGAGEATTLIVLSSAFAAFAASVVLFDHDVCVLSDFAELFPQATNAVAKSPNVVALNNLLNFML